jgi:hypothetical protein
MSFNPSPASEIELARFKNNLAGVAAYIEGKKLLMQSGIVNMLRIFARPFTADRGANVYTAAYTAAFTEGYNKALDDLVYFEEMYLSEKNKVKPVVANFGALALALSKGDLTEQEINGKRR